VDNPLAEPAKFLLVDRGASRNVAPRQISSSPRHGFTALTLSRGYRDGIQARLGKPL